MNKKIILLNIVFFVLSVLLSSCSINKNAVNDNDTQELNIYTFSDTNYLQNAVKEFEKNNPNIKINIRDFYPTDELQDYMIVRDSYNKNLLTELISGKGPDLIDVTNLPTYKYVDSGYLEELSTYMNRDVTFNLDDYNKNIIEAVNYSGQIHQFPLFYLFNLLYIDKNFFDDNEIEVFKSKKSYTYDELVELAKDKLNENTAVFVQNNISMINEFMLTYFSDFIDLKNNKVDVTNGIFEKISGNVKFYSDNNYIINEKNSDMISDFIYKNVKATDSYKFYANIPEYADNILVGIAVNDSGSAYIEHNDSYAINSNSENKELAWEFLKFMASYDMQSEYFTDYFPINNKAENTKALYDMFSFKNENEIKNLSKDDQDKISNYANEIDKYKQTLHTSIIVEPSLFIIIAESLIGYLEGEVDLHDMINSLQNKVDLYLNE